MPFTIIRNDIVSVRADAIVNPTDSFFSGGGGTDQKIHGAAGYMLDLACASLPPLSVGQIAVTKGFDLPCSYILHTVGPIWEGGANGERELLTQCYQNALVKAKDLGCESIAFPLIASGTFGYPKDQVLQVALEAIGSFLLQNDMNVFIVVYDKESFSVSRKLLHDVESFIDDQYAEDSARPQNTFSAELSKPLQKKTKSAERRRRFAAVRPNKAQDTPLSRSDALAADVCEPDREESLWDDSTLFGSSAAPPPAEKPSPSPFSFSKQKLDEELTNLDEGFSRTLLHLIDRSGMTDAECYKRANIDKRLFSKIRSNPLYSPSKPTVLAFAVALRLSLAETKALLEKAGLALSHSSKFDVIIEYFLTHGIYDMFLINQVLYQFDQQCLGNVTE